MKTLRTLITVLLVAAATITAAAKSEPEATKAQQYPGMYEEKPVTIAIMPPINRTTHAEAKDYFYTTLYRPLCEKGYYVFSPYLTMEVFQQESAYDAELFLEGSLQAFNDAIGADAVMFTIIKSWKRNNIFGTIRANVEYILRSTKTGKTLYTREGDIKLDLSVDNGKKGVSGFLSNLIDTAINTASTDKIEAGRKCSEYVLDDLPAGKYSTKFGIDGDTAAGSKVISATVK